MKTKKTREAKLKEAFAAKRKSIHESGSDHIRGDNQEGQMKAIGAKGDKVKKFQKHHGIK